MEAQQLPAGCDQPGAEIPCLYIGMARPPANTGNTQEEPVALY